MIKLLILELIKIGVHLTVCWLARKCRVIFHETLPGVHEEQYCTIEKRTNCTSANGLENADYLWSANSYFSDWINCFSCLVKKVYIGFDLFTS